MSDPPPATLWLDVDDLLHYLARHSRPSGIQRVTFELCAALRRIDDGRGRVRFLRRDGGPRDLVTLDWEQLTAAFARAANPAARAARLVTPAPAPGPRPPSAAAARVIAASRLPAAGPRRTLRAALVAQAGALLELARFARAVTEAAARPPRRGWRAAARLAGRAAGRQGPGEAAAPAARVSLGQAACPGDHLVVLGSPWSRHDYVDSVRWARDELRMRFSLLIYDLVPLRHPEWCDREVTRSFTEWHKSVLPLADRIFSISRATADDVTAWTRANGIVPASPARPIPMGTGLGGAASADAGLAGAGLAGAADATQGSALGAYALFVSTLEARKNHALLFRLWRRLLTDLPRERVPTLVFAGRVGWLVSDLMRQLENAQWLGGKIRLIEDPTDAQLASLYHGCQFTLFPSLFEGWGLPISESLALGRPCIASNRAALPEAGGALARYFDPENLDDAYRVVRAVIEDPAGLRAWRERVAREFRHVPWDHSAALILATLDAMTRAEAAMV